MPRLLTTNAIIVCPHGGMGTTTPSSTKFSIAGGLVTLEGDSGVLACPFIPLPCAGYTLRSMGLNSTSIDGRRAVLTTDFNQSFTGLPLVMTETHQGNDNSTAASLPAGGAPLPPELADMVSPVVAATTPALAFSISAPAPLAVSFQLNSPFPLQFIVTLINAPMALSLDLTNGQPPDVTVTPAGGGWSTPSLTVSIAFTPTFLAGLTAGTHTLYVTGVSQRGLNAYAQCVITVTP